MLMMMYTAHPPSSPGTKTPPEKEEHKEDPLFIGEDSGSSSLSSPASNTDKGNGSDCSSERNETESEVQIKHFFIQVYSFLSFFQVYPHKKSEHQPVLYNGKGDKNTNSKKKGKQKKSRNGEIYHKVSVFLTNFIGSTYFHFVGHCL